MTDKINSEIVAEYEKKKSQYAEWKMNYYTDSLPSAIQSKVNIVDFTVNCIASSFDGKVKELDNETISSELETLITNIAQLSKACKMAKIPSPTPRGGGSSLPTEIVNARNDAMQYCMDTLLPAFEQIFPVMGHIVRLPAGDDGMSYNEANKTAKDFLTRHLSNWIKPVTENAFRIHAKGYSQEELSDSDFLKENNMFNRAYLTTDSDGNFSTQVIDGVTVLNYERTMTNPAKKGGNS